MKSSDYEQPDGPHTTHWDGVERREFFRLDDRALLGVEIVTDVNQEVDASDSLQQLEQQISTLMYRIESRDTEMAALLRLMNQKLNRVAGLELNPNIEMPDKPVDINLSACGIRFQSSMELQQAHYLRLHLTLLPDHVNLVLIARIVALEPVPDTDEATVRAAFVNLSEGQREVLIQHMMQLQRRQMKAAADARAEAGRQN